MTAPVNQRWVQMRRWLDASVERTYQAWTQPDELARWLPFAVEGSLAVGTRSVLVWPQRRVWVDVLDAEPNRRIRFRWPLMPDGERSTEVTIELQARGLGTDLTLRDGTFDIDRPDEMEAWVRAHAGWADALANLRAALDFSVDLRLR